MGSKGARRELPAKSMRRLAVACALAGVACNALLGINPLDTGAGVDASTTDAAADATSGDDASANDAPAATFDAGLDVRVDAPPDDAALDAPPGDTAVAVPPESCDGSACPVTCDQASPCGGGSTCFQGVCHAPCGDAAPCAAPGAVCVQDYDPLTGQPLPPTMCTRRCAPERPESCGYVPARNGAGTVACVYDLTLQQTDCQVVTDHSGPCPGFTDCSPGFTCLQLTSTTSDCRRWCIVGASSGPCPIGQTCKGFSIAVYDDAGRVGICQ